MEIVGNTVKYYLFSSVEFSSLIHLTQFFLTSALENFPVGYCVTWVGIEMPTLPVSLMRLAINSSFLSGHFALQYFQKGGHQICPTVSPGTVKSSWKLLPDIQCLKE